MELVFNLLEILLSILELYITLVCTVIAFIDKFINYSWYIQDTWEADYTVWDKYLSVQMLEDSWNTICLKSIGASRSSRYYLRTSSENLENLTEFYFYQFSNLGTSPLFPSFLCILIYNIKLTKVPCLWYAELCFQNTVNHICPCKNCKHIFLLWRGTDLEEILVLIWVSLLP